MERRKDERAQHAHFAQRGDSVSFVVYESGTNIQCQWLLLLGASSRLKVGHRARAAGAQQQSSKAMERKATAHTISSNTNDQTTDQTYQVTEHFIAASNPAG
jgi:hypothetical protein